MIQRDVGNLIFGSPAFSKSSLNVWKFTVHVLLKPGLENFEHYFTSVWDECNRVVVWTFFGIGMKTDLFQSCGHCWIFQICWYTECSTFTASSFWICNRRGKGGSRQMMMSSKFCDFLVCWSQILMPDSISGRNYISITQSPRQSLDNQPATFFVLSTNIPYRLF